MTDTKFTDLRTFEWRPLLDVTPYEVALAMRYLAIGRPMLEPGQIPPELARHFVEVPQSPTARWAAVDDDTFLEPPPPRPN